jgi:hypothetical protein
VDCPPAASSLHGVQPAVQPRRGTVFQTLSAALGFLKSSVSPVKPAGSLSRFPSGRSLFSLRHLMLEINKTAHRRRRGRSLAARFAILRDIIAPMYQFVGRVYPKPDPDTPVRALAVAGSRIPDDRPGLARRCPAARFSCAKGWCCNASAAGTCTGEPDHPVAASRAARPAEPGRVGPAATKAWEASCK